MVDINSTIINAPLLEGMISLINTLKVLVGGVFGIYIIMLVWRIYTYKRNRAFYKKLHRDVVHMSAAIEELQTEVKKLGERMHTKKAKHSK